MCPLLEHGLPRSGRSYSSVSGYVYESLLVMHRTDFDALQRRAVHISVVSRQLAQAYMHRYGRTDEEVLRPHSSQTPHRDWEAEDLPF